MTSLRNLFPFLFLIVFTISFAACDDDPFKVDYSDVPPPFDIENAERVETESGLVYYVVEEGSGAFEVLRVDEVSVFYTGRKVSDGTIIDSSYRNGSRLPAIFRNLDSLIEGFREGLIGMKEGEKRVLIIPPSLAYENARPGSPNYGLRNDTLRFDVELNEIISD